jgi:hypothetical protein
MSGTKQKSQGSHVALEQKALANGRVCLSSAIEYGFVGPLDILPESFHPDLQPVARFVREARQNGAKDFPDVLAFLIQSTEPGEKQDLLRSRISDVSEEVTQIPESLERSAAIVHEYDLVKRRQHLLWKLNAANDQGEPIDELLRQLSGIDAGGTRSTLSTQLKTRAFDFDLRPPPPIPRLQLCGMPLCTAGNLLNIQALPKAGKTAVVESMIAAIFNNNRQGPDTLGFSAENPQGFAIVHFDTEQSRFDHDSLVRRACRRARVEKPPAGFFSYFVADLDISARRLALVHVMREARETHSGIFAVMIDGIGDLCGDPNDSEESFDLVHELHALAITYDCTIITVLHENPGSDSGKTRGHLGSQLERKAETNLRLAKDANGITTMWAERARHCYLPKNQGPCFSWNDEHKMHTSCGTAGEIKSAASREKMEDEASKAFSEGESFRHGNLVHAIMNALDLKEKSAKERIRKWNAEGIIQKDSGGEYHLTEP